MAGDISGPTTPPLFCETTRRRNLVSSQWSSNLTKDSRPGHKFITPSPIPPTAPTELFTGRRPRNIPIWSEIQAPALNLPFLIPLGIPPFLISPRGIPARWG
jgi:hypothetical protein